MIRSGWAFYAPLVRAIARLIAVVTVLVSSQPLALAQQVKSDSRVDQGWLATVKKSIEVEEYRPSKRMVGTKGETVEYPKWHLVNRAHGFRSFVSREGWEIVPRLPVRRIDPKDPTKHLEESAPLGADSPRWYWRYTFSELSRGDTRTKHSAPIVSEDKETVRLSYSRSVSEWYRNTKAGIEQGFEIKERPFPRGKGELVLIGDIKTDLIAVNSTREKIGFSKDGVEVFRYAGLKVIDATGKTIPSWLSYSTKGEAKRLLIHIDDAEGVYPLVVDPLATSAAWTGEGNQAAAEYGWSVGTAGDVNGDGFSDVIVGAMSYSNGESNEGRAYLYLGTSTGLQVTAAWTGESDQAFARYGYSVGTAGDVNADGFSDVLVSAYRYDNGNTDEGRVYLYLGSSTGLSNSPAWVGEGDQDNADFGYSVGTAGDINGDGYSDVVIGARLYDGGDTDEGRAFLFLGSSSGLDLNPAWTAELNQPGSQFGFSVGSAGDVNADGYSDVVVGARFYSNGQTSEGGAFLFLGSSSGLALTPAWTGESNQASALYGSSVGTAGDVNGDGYSDVIVGAELYDNGQSDEGGAWLYLGGSGGLANMAAWTGESNQAYAWYGCSAKTAGDINGDGYSDVIVGAYAYSNGENYEGRAYVYLGSVSGLAATATWISEADQQDAYYGWSVGTAGDINGDGFSDVLVGANLDGTDYEGRAYLYLGSAAGLNQTESWTGELAQPSTGYGWSVSSAGDVNGDGYSDVVVGAPSHDNGGGSTGAVFLYLGSPAGLSSTASWSGTADGSGGFGRRVSSAGDVNGDGYSDVLVGAPLYSNGETQEGRVYLYLGSAAGLYPTPSWTRESNQISAHFGESVSTAGDVNGDGYSDVIIGAPYYDNGEAQEGTAYVYLGSASGLSSAASWVGESDQVGAYYGMSVSTAGDVNGDGYSDVVIGASNYDDGEADEGRAYLYLGSSSGLSTAPAWTSQPNQAEAGYGRSVSAAGDVNGDGYSDVLVGAPSYDNGESNEGRAFLYPGSATGLAATASWTAESDLADSNFAHSLSTAGDVNGDGYSDVVIGAWGFSNGQSNEGRAFLFLGDSDGLLNTASWTAERNVESAFFAQTINDAGDVNGDGYSDVVVGTYDGAIEKAFLYLGNTSGGISLAPRQLNASDNPVEVLGNPGSNGSFKIRLNARSVAGRAKVRLVWENKPLGSALDGTGLGRGATFADSTTDGVILTETVTGLSASTSYHWRVRVETFPQSYSPWYSIGNNGAQEADLRYLAAPIATPTVTPTSTATPLSTSVPQEPPSSMPGDVDDNSVPDAAFLGKGKAPEVVLSIDGTPTKLLLSGVALAIDIGTAPGDRASSMISVEKSANSFAWRATTVLTGETRVFQTTIGTGMPVVGCYVGDNYTAASYLPSRARPQLKLYVDSGERVVKLPKGAIDVRCGNPVGGESAVFSLVRNAQKKTVNVVASVGGARLFNSPALSSIYSQDGMQLGIVPRAAGTQPTAMILARKGKGKARELLVRDRINKWRTVPIPGIPPGSIPSAVAGVRHGSTTYIVVQLTGKSGETSYKSVIVPASYL